MSLFGFDWGNGPNVDLNGLKRAAFGFGNDGLRSGLNSYLGLDNTANYLQNGPGSPDYHGAAMDQAAWSQNNTNAQTQANRPNQYNPWGSSEWTQGPDGQWSQKTSLNGNLQSALDSQQGMQAQRSQLASGLMGQVGQEMSTPFDWNGLPQVGNGADARQHAEDAIYNQATSRLDPMWNQREEQQRTALVNQGLDPSSEAYKNQMADFGRNRNDAYQGAINNAVMGGGQEASRDFGMNMQARQQGIGEGQQRQNWTLNNVNGLLAGQGIQNPQFAGFNGAGVAQTPGLFNAADSQGQFDLGKWQRQVGSMTDLIGGAGGLAKGLFGFL